MYKQLSRAQSRETAGHVCLSCRRQLYVRRQLLVAQQRRNQQHNTAPQQDSGGDDWMNNFNDLSPAAPSPKSSRPADSDVAGFETLKKRLHEEKKSGNRSDKAAKKMVRVARSEWLNVAKRKRPTRRQWAMERAAKAGEQAQVREGAQISESHDRPEGHGSTIQNATPTSEVDSSQATAERLRFEQILADINVNPSPAVEGTETRATEDNNARTSPPDASPTVLRSHSTLLREDDRRSTARSVVRSHASNTNVRIYNFAQPVDDIEVPQGQVSSETAEKPDNGFPDDVAAKAVFPPYKVAKPLPASSGGVTMNNLASKARMVRDRPKWGGLTITPHQPSTFKTSFDTLREADQVTPPSPVPATASTAKPWGLQAARAQAAMSEFTPQSVPEALWERAQSENSAEAKPSSSLGGMFGFNKLKAILYGAPPVEQATETPSALSTKPPNVDDATEFAIEPNRSQSEGAASDPGAADKQDSPLDPQSDRLRRLYETEQERMRHSSTRSELTKRNPASESAAALRGSHESSQSERNSDGSSQTLEELLASQFSFSNASESVKPGAPTSPPDKVLRTERRSARQQRRITRAAEQAKRAEAAAAHNAQLLGDEIEDAPSADIETGRPLWEVMQGQQFAEAVAGASSEERSARSVDVHAMVEKGDEPDDSGTLLDVIDAKNLSVTALNVPQPAVPGLSYGLDRVLFNPGVYQLQDPHSRVYNFDNYLQDIMPVTEFDFNALKEYKTSSQDIALASIAAEHGKKYVGSTSSMTSTLSHFHYLLSNWRDLNLNMLSQGFRENRKTFTNINRAPTAIFLRYKKDSQTYAIDADKEYDSGNVLMMLGKSMEKLLTMPKDEYERYRKSDSRKVSDEERNAPEAFEYTTMGDFLMRSQLDAYDKRLPGNGTFDIKTRAVVSIRMNTTDYVPMLGYQIHTLHGHYESYEREYYDMLRSTMLKYMLQARMGRMDGIFLTYHNVQRIFGFQYLQMAEIDRAIHGQVDHCLGDQEFRVSLELLNKVLDQATAKFPEKSLRFHFETRASPVVAMYVFAEPVEEDEIDRIQSKSKGKIAEFEREMMGIKAEEHPASVEKEAAETKHEDDAAASTTKAADKPAPTSSDEQASYYDSTSSANRPFIDSMVPPDNLAPLYAATLITSSTVNGDVVDRPQRLTRDDEWQVEYLLKEIDPVNAWATYAQTKASRKKAFDSTPVVNDEGDAEDPPEPQFNEFFERLKRIAREGREFRAKMDELEKGNKAVIFKEGEGVDAGSTIADEKDAVEEQSTPVDDARVESVDGYMDWLYKSR